MGQGKFVGYRPAFYHCATQPTDVQDRMALFRLCVNAADHDRLLNADVWPDSIRIAGWFF